MLPLARLCCGLRVGLLLVLVSLQDHVPQNIADGVAVTDTKADIQVSPYYISILLLCSMHAQCMDARRLCVQVDFVQEWWLHGCIFLYARLAGASAVQSLCTLCS
jgi:hypothetical protein